MTALPMPPRELFFSPAATEIRRQIERAISERDDSSFERLGAEHRAIIWAGNPEMLALANALAALAKCRAA